VDEEGLDEDVIRAVPSLETAAIKSLTVETGVPLDAERQDDLLVRALFAPVVSESLTISDAVALIGDALVIT
jgi:hypothetical protein